MAWLQGGPFLEVSFILKEISIKLFISKLLSLPGICNVEEDITKKENMFEDGYYFDEDDPDSIKIHSLNLNLLIQIAGNRKSELLVHKIATETLLIEFCFYGSELDALEWGQKGIAEEEYKHFVSFLSQMLGYFQGIIGSVAIEKDVLELIPSIHTYPNEDYRYDKIDNLKLVDQFVKSKSFIAVGYSAEDKIVINCK